MAIKRTSRSSGADVIGLKDFLAELKAMGPEWPKMLLEVHKEVSGRGAEWSRYTLAGSGTRAQQLAIDAIRGKATAKEARIGVTNGSRIPFALAVIWGAKRRSGWYGDAARYKQSVAVQFPTWVGKTWDVAVAGQGPYGINDALANHLPDILEFYQQGLARITAKAFPE